MSMEGKECPRCESKDTELTITINYYELWECFNCQKTFFIRDGLIDKPQEKK